MGSKYCNHILFGTGRRDAAGAGLTERPQAVNKVISGGIMPLHVGALVFRIDKKSIMQIIIFCVST